MRWPVVENNKRVQPTTGNYKKWKEQVAEACSHSCVYCAISEGRFGGVRNFHVEHYRPKVEHSRLENVIENLYYACSICNLLKGADWPGNPTPDLDTLAYPDPGDHDFNELLPIDVSTFVVSSEKVAVRYMVERLILNRPQLITERRLHVIGHASTDAIRELCDKCDKLFGGEVGDREKILLREALAIIHKLTDLRDRMFEARPYRRSDVSR